MLVLVVVLAAALTFSGCLGGVGQKTYVASGRVTDIGGHGVGGVKIIFSGGYVGTTVTDSEGRWKAYSLTIGAIRSHLQRLQA